MSRAFPFPTGKRSADRIVTHSKKKIDRCDWPTESTGQLLRHIDPQARYFISIDLTYGYYQACFDEESSNLLVIANPMGRFS